MKCDDCDCLSCKHCSFIIDGEVFELVSLLPDSIKDKAFCPNCYNDKYGAIFEEQLEILERAKDVNVYSKIQTKETRLIRRIHKPIHIKECEGREETLLRLAFLAAKEGYDTLVDVDLTTQKIGTKSYIRLLWNGVAVPVDPKIKK